MNLITLLRGSLIEGMPMKDLRDILRGDRTDVWVKSGTNGLLVLSNKKIVRCVNKYYVKPGEHHIKKFRSKSNICHEVHQKLGINVPAMDCRACHMSCMNKVDNSELRVFTNSK